MILEIEGRHAEGCGSACVVPRQDPLASVREQFDELTKPLIRHLLVHAHSILQSDDLAWDAVQESLLGLWQKAQDGNSVLDFAGPWLCRAVILRSLQIARQNGRRSRYERLAATHRTDLMSCPAENGQLEVEELRQVIGLAIAALPDEFRAVLERRIHQGLDYSAISQQLGIPVGTVRSRLNRARTMLQEILESATCRSAPSKAQSNLDSEHSGCKCQAVDSARRKVANCSSYSDREAGSR